MIERIYLLLEALSVVICLHRLYNEKFKLDIFTTCFLVIDMIIMTTVSYYDLSRIYTMIIYPIIWVYCGFRFGFKWRALIINNILCIAIIGVIQVIIAMVFGYISNILLFDNNEIIIINLCVFAVVLLILPKFRIHMLSIYLQDKERILIILMIFSVLVMVYSVTSYKAFSGMEVYQCLILFVGVALFFMLAGKIGKYKIQSKEIETELKMHQLYADSFQNLIKEIRLRQHEFDNHINTIYSLHYTCKTYEELVNAQKEYGHEIVIENRHNKLLSAGNPLLIGFLYGQVIEIEKLGIGISYKISIGEFDVGVPIYRLIELLGNLLKNAVEASLGREKDQALYIAVVEMEGTFDIEVRNKSEFIDYIDINSFFKRGYSKKGTGRGLGLFNVKTICNEYSLKIKCENKSIDNENWLWFGINNRKETI